MELSELAGNLKRGSLFSVVENIFNSATSFLLSIFLINATSPEEFGRFNVVFISITLVLAVGTALFNNQIALVSAKKIGVEREASISTLSISYHGLNLLFSLVLYIVIDFVFNWGFGLFIFLYSFLYNFRENVKTILYLNDSSEKAAFSTIALFLLVLACCGLFNFYLKNFNMAHFIFFVSSCYVISCYMMATNYMSYVSLGQFKFDILIDNINYSKWSLAAGVATWGQSNIYAYLVAYFHGAVYVGYISATRLVMMPLNVLIAGVFSGVKSQLSLLYEADRTAVRTKVFSLYFIMTFFTVIYSLFFWYFWRYIDKYFFAGKYDEIAYLVLLWGIYFSCQSARVGVTNYLQLGLHFKKIGVVSIPLYVVSIICIFLSAKYMPFYHTVLVMAFFELLMFVILFRWARKWQ